MSYEPLHHKYRPKSFAELVGQEAIATTLTNAIRTARIAPAYLFTGPRGTGKTSSARILAKSLNCLKNPQPTPQPCGVCGVCQAIAKSSSLDVIEIDAASNTGVDNIREIIERAQFAPVQCRYKVYVIDECHMLSTQAFNALLKTLEEPPKQVVFVLATTDPQRVLPTIISRCQRFDFRRIPLEAMIEHLSAIASKEKINITSEAITLIAQISQGGLRDAESLLDQLSLISAEVTPDRVWDLVGSVSERDLLLLLQAIATDKAEAVLDCIRILLDRGREPLIILQNLAGFYRDLLIAKTASSRNDLVACTQQTWKTLVDFAQHFDTSQILVGQQHLRTAEVQLKNTTQPRLWLEVTLLGLLPSANAVGQRNLQALSTNKVSSPIVLPHPPVQAHKRATEYVTTPTTPTAPVSHSPTPSSPPPTTPTPTPAPSEQENVDSSTEDASLESKWHQVLESLSLPSSKGLFKEHGRLLEIKNGVAVVGMPPKLVKMASKLTIEDFETAFSKVFQQKVKINLVPNQPQVGAISQQKSASPSLQQKPTQYQAKVQTSEIPKVDNTPKAKSEPATNAPVAPIKETSNNIPTSPPPTQPAINHGALPPPPTQSTIANDEIAERVLFAAQRLAQAVNGEIISLTDNSSTESGATDSSEWGDESEVNDD